MRCRYRVISLLLVMTFLPVCEAGADSYRCGRKIVRDGDTVAQLLALCGEPRFKSRGAAVIRVDGVDKRTSVQRWHYKKGSRSLERIVLIYQGRIAAIEVGGR